MFNLSNDIIRNIIDKAKAVSLNDELYTPGNNDATESEDNLVVLAENKDDLTLQELRYTINDLEPDQQKELIALFFIGRGDYDTSQWSDALMQAEEITPKTRADFLIQKPMLADYLAEAMALFGYAYDESSR